MGSQDLEELVSALAERGVREADRPARKLLATVGIEHCRERLEYWDSADKRGLKNPPGRLLSLLSSTAPLPAAADTLRPPGESLTAAWERYLGRPLGAANGKG